MHSVCPPAPQLGDIEPYNPKYLAARTFLSANENPHDVERAVRREMMSAIKRLPLNRYPDPLANDLRDMIAEANGLDRDQVLVGNGGDELLFNLALAWGGPGRTFLNLPPTFSIYENNARLTNTAIVNIPRTDDYAIDEEAVLARVARGGIDFLIVTSPNNPTGELANETFIVKLLEATDALVMVDEAYFEFSRLTMRPYLQQHKNLVILRTFSKAFSLAGIRLGYILGEHEVIREFVKVRQPYSVDAVSQVVAQVAFSHRASFGPGIQAIIEQRSRLIDGMKRIPGVKPYPSHANYVLLRVANARIVWEMLYARGILVRDFSQDAYLENCLRVSVGTPEENDAFLAALRDVVMGKCDLAAPSAAGSAD